MQIESVRSTVWTLLTWAVLILWIAVVYVGSRPYVAEMEIQSYFECIRKVNTYDWGRVDGGKPGRASEICGKPRSHG
jgi:hypothetical protein